MLIQAVQLQRLFNTVCGHGTVKKRKAVGVKGAEPPERAFADDISCFMARDEKTYKILTLSSFTKALAVSRNAILSEIKKM